MFRPGAGPRYIFAAGEGDTLPESSLLYHLSKKKRYVKIIYIVVIAPARDIFSRRGKGGAGSGRPQDTYDRKTH